MGILTNHLHEIRENQRRKAESRYDTQDASLSWKPGFWMAAQGDLQQPQEDEAFITFKTRSCTRMQPPEAGTALTCKHLGTLNTTCQQQCVLVKAIV